jgi:deoxyribodipyrimidine photolyase-related protein
MRADNNSNTPRRKLLCFPTTCFVQLPDPDIATALTHIDVIEEPSLIYEAGRRPFRVNKVKVAFFRATLKAFFDKLKQEHPTARVIYHEYKSVPGPSHFKGYHAWDPCDDVIRKKYKGFVSFVANSPAFLLSEADMDALHARRAVRLTAVFNHVKQKLPGSVIEPGVPSYDKENRKPLPAGALVPPSPLYVAVHVDEAIAYASLPTFAKHVGNPESVRLCPTTHQQAEQHMQYFVQKRFAQFGPYEDAVASREQVLFHSNISHLLNVGLLTPAQVVAHAASGRTCKSIPIASYEGFLRQVLGWREFQRYLYERYKGEVMAPFMASNNKLKRSRLDPFKWTTSIPAIDMEIAKAKETGYAHHIVRLMFFLNYMKLAGIHPAAINRWFQEVVSIDAYDWVMYSNIASMGYYTTPAFVARPYLASSAYIARMSDYKERSPALDRMFRAYLAEHKVPFYRQYAK